MPYAELRFGKKHVIHPLMSKRHNDAIDIITQKLPFKCDLKYDV